MSTASAALVIGGGVPSGHLTELGQLRLRPPVASCLKMIEQDPARPCAGGLARTSEVTFWVRMTSKTLPVSRSRVSVPELISGAGLVSA